MTFTLTPGSAIVCKVNSHRHGWNGSICQHASNWNCGGEQYFRESYCEHGDPRCFHLNLFDPAKPFFEADDNGVGWILGDDEHALDDQILLLWAAETREPRGIRESGYVSQHLIGAYRIRAAYREQRNWHTYWRIEPHPDAWTRFASYHIDRPRYQNMGGRYIKEVERNIVQRVFRDTAAATQDDPGKWFDPKDAERFTRFHEQLSNWLDIAAEKMQALLAKRPQRTAQGKEVWSSGSPASKTLVDIAKVIENKVGDTETTTAQPAVATKPVLSTAPATTAPPTPPAVELPRPGPTCVDPSRLAQLRTIYGEQLYQALRVAALTKPLIILRGHPGVGKSHFVLNLLDDPQRERILTIPVGSTWRGREDLLGYVNPLNHEFEPTPFTEFLLAAERAWRAGDRRARNVVFEEFNLSQPEHWLADILAVSQYQDEADREIHLGGAGIRGQAKGQKPRVFLSPAVSFLATINTDHTTRPLSPRVLDRAALIDLRIETKDALDRVEVQLEDDETEAIADLDFVLRPKGASFSMRSARSLKACLERLEELSLDRWRAIDLVLAQGVLSKVRLLARDPNDEALMQELKKWSDQHGRHLRTASDMIGDWEEALRTGTDVIQA